MFEFAWENALVNELQPAVFPFDGADFVVSNSVHGCDGHGREYTVSSFPRKPCLLLSP